MQLSVPTLPFDLATVIPAAATPTLAGGVPAVAAAVSTAPGAFSDLLNAEVIPVGDAPNEVTALTGSPLVAQVVTAEPPVIGTPPASIRFGSSHSAGAPAGDQKHAMPKWLMGEASAQAPSLVETEVSADTDRGTEISLPGDDDESDTAMSAGMTYQQNQPDIAAHVEPVAINLVLPVQNLERSSSRARVDDGAITAEAEDTSTGAMVQGTNTPPTLVRDQSNSALPDSPAPLFESRSHASSRNERPSNAKRSTASVSPAPAATTDVDVVAPRSERATAGGSVDTPRVDTSGRDAPRASSRAAIPPRADHASDLATSPVLAAPVNPMSADVVDFTPVRTSGSVTTTTPVTMTGPSTNVVEPTLVSVENSSRPEPRHQAQAFPPAVSTTVASDARQTVVPLSRDQPDSNGTVPPGAKPTAPAVLREVSEPGVGMDVRIPIVADQAMQSVVRLNQVSVTEEFDEVVNAGPDLVVAPLRTVPSAKGAVIPPAMRAALEPARTAAIQPANEAAIPPAERAAVESSKNAAVQPARGAAIQSPVAPEKSQQSLSDLSAPDNSARIVRRASDAGIAPVIQQSVEPMRTASPENQRDLRLPAELNAAVMPARPAIERPAAPSALDLAAPGVASRETASSFPTATESSEPFPLPVAQTPAAGKALESLPAVVESGTAEIPTPRINAVAAAAIKSGGTLPQVDSMTPKAAEVIQQAATEFTASEWMPQVDSKIPSTRPSGAVISKPSIKAATRVDTAFVGTGRGSEKIAALSSNSGDAPELAENGSIKKSLTSGLQEVAGGTSPLGINVAKVGSAMPALAHPTSSAPAIEAPSFAAVPLTFDALVREGAQPPSELAQAARRAVESAMAVVDHYATGEQKSVNLQFTVSGVDLAVRVELRGESVHTTFRTDSPELRHALATEWQAVSASQAGDRPQRLADPVFTSAATSSSSSNEFGSATQHRDSGARQQPAPPPEFSGFRNASGHGAATAAPAVPRNIPVSTSSRLNTFA